tara:strand:+ start:742 stop:1590 length:849 start_codon:yes stop_codon:yes gene_type:complete
MDHYTLQTTSRNIPTSLPYQSTEHIDHLNKQIHLIKNLTNYDTLMTLLKHCCKCSNNNTNLKKINTLQRNILTKLINYIHSANKSIKQTCATNINYKNILLLVRFTTTDLTTLLLTNRLCYLLTGKTPRYPNSLPSTFNTSHASLSPQDYIVIQNNQLPTTIKSLQPTLTRLNLLKEQSNSIKLRVLQNHEESLEDYRDTNMLTTQQTTQLHNLYQKHSQLTKQHYQFSQPADLDQVKEKLTAYINSHLQHKHQQKLHDRIILSIILTTTLLLIVYTKKTKS